MRLRTPLKSVFMAIMVERWLSIPIGVRMIHFFHPGLMQRNGVLTFMCQGPNPPGKTVFDREPITRTALDLRIITSLDIDSRNDLATALRMLRRDYLRPIEANVVIEVAGRIVGEGFAAAVRVSAFDHPA